jgi:biopolymer transport protein ExbD
MPSSGCAVGWPHRLEEHAVLNRVSEDHDYHDQINMIPLIDVMLVLLVVFLITAPLMQTALSLQLPAVQAPAVATAAETRHLRIDAEAAVWWDDQPSDWSRLPAQLAAPAAGAQLRIQADQALPFARVAQALSLAQAAGWQDIAVMTSPPPTTAP